MRLLFVLALFAPLLGLAQDGGVRRGRTVEEVKLLYFHAAWCQSCKRFDASGALAKAKERVPQLVVQDVDADREVAALEKYGIVTIPALVLVDASGFPLGRPRIELEDGTSTAERVVKLVEKMTRAK